MCPTLKAEGLSMQFGSQVVLSNVNLEMQGGQIYGLVGRNGSGKTVLMKLLCGLLAPTSGAIWVNDQPVISGKRLPCVYGVHFDTAGFLPNLSGKRNLRLLSRLRGIANEEDVERAIENVGLDPHSRKKVRAYSLGMRQRLSIAQMLMEKPELILLDEPMNGLDSDAVEQVRAILLKEKERGALIVVATHIKEDVDRLCDTVYRVANTAVTQIEEPHPI